MNNLYEEVYGMLKDEYEGDELQVHLMHNVQLFLWSQIILE